MAPETRSRGVPPPSRVYHSTPALQQAQFPSRRRIVRQYGKKNQQQQQGQEQEQRQGNQGRSRGATPASMRRDPRQKTLTQIDFVSSSLSEAATVVLSDSEEEEFARTAAGAADDKENEGPDDEEDEEEPVSSGKRKRRSGSVKSNTTANPRKRRRRTLGDETERKGGKREKKDTSRRKTLGDTPSSKYHTQTLTQLLGREELNLIKDSEDEGGDDDGFDDWYNGPESPSPRPKKLPHDDPSPTKHRRSAMKDTRQETSRQPSVVPQTPVKRTIRFEIPSSSHQSTPTTARMLDRYGPPDQEKPSPSVKSGQKVPEPVAELPGKPKGTPAKLVIEDSFATDSWGSGVDTPSAGGTPLKDITAQVTGRGAFRRESSSMAEVMSTPTRPMRRGGSAELGEKTPTKASPGKSSRKTPSPKKVSIGGVYEIPDSDEDDGEFSETEHEYNDGPREAKDGAANQEKTESNCPSGEEQPANEDIGEEDDGYVAGPETQFAMNELASSVDHLSRTPTQQSSTRPLDSSVGQTPGPQQSHPSTTPASSTSAIQQPLPSQQLPPPQPSHQPPTKAATPPRPKPSGPLRKPLRHLPSSSQTQPLESQRVPLATIQGFGHPTNRTDIFLATPASPIDLLASGHQIDLRLSFKIPTLVARFWLYDGSLLRYAACVEPGVKEQARQGHLWRYHVNQLYELNNPTDEQDMKEEGWLDDDYLNKPYIYLPPVGVCQLLANLRHALFGDDGDEAGEEQQESQQQLPPSSSFSVSQQVEAQLRSDIAHHHTQAQLPHSDHQLDDAILVPSTPLKDRSDQTPRARKPPVHPSQATTASQASTPEKQSQHPPPHPPPPPPPSTFRRPPLPQSSSEPFTLQDHEGSSPPFLLPCSNPGVSLSSSQLLTKSQMLPDSLIRDDARMPPEIWDSDEDQD